MRVLLLHPEASPGSGPWSQQRWDLIVDLGFASLFLYEQWSRQSGARVLSIYQFTGQQDSFRWVNRALDHGRGLLIDRVGLDWWELLAMWGYQDFQRLYLAEQLLSETSISNVDVIWASRPHPFTQLLAQVLKSSISYFEQERRGPVARLSRMLHSAHKLRPVQIAEIVLDKWDPGHQLRRHVSRHKRARSLEPVVLLPSAYSNVTRVALAYATRLPQRQFLLVTTRRSALPDRLPANVTATPLGAYALPAPVTRAEVIDLRQAWEVFLRQTVREVDALRQAADAGFLDYVPAHLENGLRLREAWRTVLTQEPVKGVLCGDDLNYHTRLPLVLAKQSGLNAVYCSHGALDGGFLFKLPYADTFLVKGEMERDYMERARDIDPDRIVVAAPGVQTSISQAHQRSEALVFFSQPFEVQGGRADEIYKELLPRLYAAAHRSSRRLILKLHPFESRQARRTLVASILPVGAPVEIVAGVSPEEVMSRTWCGVTVDSSVAVECALRKIPFFLCGWLDFMGFGYLRQFARFGVARVLETPEDLERLPELIDSASWDTRPLQRLWHEADPGLLDEILFASRHLNSPHPCAY